jgi:hypothetical protein
MPPACGRAGYHPVEITQEHLERSPKVCVELAMQTVTSQQAVKMRALAARLREHACETSVEMFRCKFEAVAADLEEAASRIEQPFRLAG